MRPLRNAALLALAFPLLLVHTTAEPAAASGAVRVAPSDAVEEGRAHLEAGRLSEARAAFERAHGADGTFATRVWILRVDLAEGRIDDVLSAASSARRAGERGMDLDYIVGMAMHARAMADLARGGSPNVGMFFGDAMNSLREVTAANAERYRDAFLPLAESAWHSGEPKVALEAAREAAARAPQRADVQRMRGRAALSTWREAGAADGGDAAVWEESRDAYRRAAELLAEPRGAAALRLAADVQYELGNVFAFREQFDAALDAYVASIAFDPAASDLGQLLGIVGQERFPALVERAAEAFVARHGNRDAREATLRWWLGWALLNSNDPSRLDEAETAFLAAVERWPAFTNSWFHIFKVRFAKQDFPAAILALAKMREVDAAGLQAQLRWDPSDLVRIEFLVGRSVREQKLLDAVWLTELVLDATPEDQVADRARHHNNIGLFFRDEGDRRRAAARRRTMSEEESAELMELYERSLAAYEQALALDPENPAFLNDTAVVLHYNLQREYDRALAMYAKAAERAQALLDGGGLEAEIEELFRIALRDARNNSRLLERRIEAEREAAEKAAREEAERREREGEGGDGDGAGNGDGRQHSMPPAGR